MIFGITNWLVSLISPIFFSTSEIFSLITISIDLPFFSIVLGNKSDVPDKNSIDVCNLSY